MSLTKWAWLVVGVLALSQTTAACGDAGGALSLSVSARTALVAGPEFNLVETDLLEDVADVHSAASLRHFERNAAFGDSFVDGVSVAHINGVVTGQHLVRVRLRRPDGRVLIERRVRVSVSSDTVIVVELTRDCVGVSCPGAGSVALSECLGAQCVTPECTAEHRELCSDVRFCNTDEECSEVAACAMKHCADGLCEPRPRDGACADDEWCDPEIGAGCTPLTPSTVDAGVPDMELGDMYISEMDASVDDSGIDAGESVCGRLCNVGENSCRLSVWNCDGSEPVCVALPLRPTGTTCGEDHVCNLAGECVLCEHAGEPCTIGCRHGTMSCSRGWATCELDALGSPDPLGTPCAPGICIEGETCDRSANTCIDEGYCVPCVDGLFCNPTSCTEGQVVCALGGTCEPTGFVDTGTLCASLPDSYCNDAHACAPCTSGPCEYEADPCRNGLRDCTVNPDVCAPGTLKDAGTSCGEGRTCDATGNCVACVDGAACGTECAPATISCASGSGVCTASGPPIAAGGPCGPGRVCSQSGACEDCTDGASCGTDICEVGGILSCATGRFCSFALGGPVGTSCGAGQVCDGLGRCIAPLVGTDISAFADASCMLLVDGQVRCFGSLAALAQPLIPNLVRIAAGASAICGIDNAGDVWCWGANYTGQLGDGTTTDRSEPFHVPLSADAVDIAASATGGVCAVLVDGSLWCWGGGFSGTVDLSPRALALSNVTRVVYGSTHACAIVSPSASVNEVWCWGEGSSGQLGDDLYTTSVDPVQATGVSDALDIVVGEQFTCVLHESGSMSCMGMGAVRDMGAPFSLAGVAQVVATPFATIAALASGEYHVCVLDDGGDVACLGMLPGVGDWNPFGILGSSMAPLDGSPVLTTGLHDVVEISGGGLHTCARDALGAMYCWGQNMFGELGVDPATTPNGITPVNAGGPF